jgi:tellurite methyltransferase
MAEADRARWDERYRAGTLADERPNAWLVGAAGWLPEVGAALDLACGEGQALVWLAERGLRGTGIDISGVGLVRARALAEARGVADRVALVAADLEGWRPEAQWDVVLCLLYLDRALVPAIRSAVRPGGLAVVQLLAGDAGRAFRVERGELLRWFVDWEVLRYEEGPRTSAIVARR